MLNRIIVKGDNMLSYIKDILFWKLRGEIPLWAYTKRGLKVGKNFSIEPGCNLDYSHCWLIEIGEAVTLAPRVQILVHDASTKKALGYTKLGRVKIGSRVFIGAGTIILPNVTIGNDVVIGAGSVITKDIPDGSVAAGNPARIIGESYEYFGKNRKSLKENPIYGEEFTVRKNINEEKKKKMIEELDGKIGFID